MLLAPYDGSAPPSRVMLAPLFLALALGLLAFVAVELVARWWLWRAGYYVWPRHFRRVLQVDRDTMPQLEPQVAFEVNGDGERGPEVGDAEGMLRILAVGGSTVEAALTDQATCWSTVVAALLNAPDARAALGVPRVHVGNVGRSGLTLGSLREVLERTSPRYGRLGEIWVIAGPGDVVRWLERGAPADGAPEPPPVDEVFAQHPELGVGLRLRDLALVECARRAVLSTIRPVRRHAGAGRWIAEARAMRRAATRFRDEVPDAARFLDDVEEQAHALFRVAARCALRTRLVLQPRFRKARYTPEEDALFWGGGIGNPYRGERVTEYYTTRVLMELIDEVDRRLVAVAARHGVAVIDAGTALRPDAGTFYDHFHLTPDGGAQLARLLRDAILDAPTPVTSGPPDR